MIIIVALIGLVLSAYAYSLECKLKINPDYKPVCDISDAVSCSKPFKSEYTNVFYCSNSLLGMLFYAGIILLQLLGFTHLTFYAAVLGCLGSAVLAYILYFKIKTLCVICTTLYVVNGLLLYFSL